MDDDIDNDNHAHNLCHCGMYHHGRYYFLPRPPGKIEGVESFRTVLGVSSTNLTTLRYERFLDWACALDLEDPVYDEAREVRSFAPYLSIGL